MNDKMILQIPAYLQKYESMANGVLKLIIHTQEDVNKEHVFRIMEFKEKLAWLTMVMQEKDGKEYKIEPEDLLNLPELNEKVYDLQESPSKKLRNTLYVYFTKALNKNPADFNNFYIREVERMRQKYLEHIPKDK